MTIQLSSMMIRSKLTLEYEKHLLEAKVANIILDLHFHQLNEIENAPTARKKL